MKLTIIFVTIILGATIGLVDGVCKADEDLTAAERIILEKHNELREQHDDTDDLCYGESGEDINFSSSTWIQQVATNKALSHSTPQDYNPGDITKTNYYGENLAAAGTSGSVDDIETAYTSAVQAWYDEIQFWDFSTSSVDEEETAGHFTQVVWKDSEQVNCGYATYVSTDGNNWYAVVCQYYPAGNWVMEGEYAANVQPLKADEQECAIPTITDGTVSPSDHEIGNGEEYTVTCSPDYELSGSSVMTCTADSSSATLSAAPTCTEASGMQKCQKPTIADGTVSPSSAEISNGEQYTVACNNEFELSGSSILICSADSSSASLSTPPTCPEDKGAGFGLTPSPVVLLMTAVIGLVMRFL